MKKTIICLVVLCVVFVGTSFFVSNKVKQWYESQLDSLNSAYGMKVVSSSYNKGLFESTAEFKLEISDIILYRIFSIFNGHYFMTDKPFVLEIKSNIKHNILKARVDSDSVVRIFDFAYKDDIVDLFKKDEIAKISTTYNLNGNMDMSVKFTDIDYGSKYDNIQLNNFLIDFKNIKNNKFSNYELTVDKIYFTSGNKLRFRVNNFNSHYALKDQSGLSLIRLLTRPLPAKWDVSIKKLELFSRYNDFDINLENIQLDSTYTQKTKDFIDSNDVLNIAKIQVNDFSFKDINLHSVVENIKTNTIEKMNLAGMTDDTISELLDNNMSIGIKNLSFKNMNNDTLSVFLDARLSGYDKNLDIQDNLAKFGEMNIDILTSSSFYKFFQDDEDIKMFEDAFIMDGLIDKINNGVKLNLKYDKNRQDMLINNKKYSSDLDF